MTKKIIMLIAFLVGGCARCLWDDLYDRLNPPYHLSYYCDAHEINGYDPKKSFFVKGICRGLFDSITRNNGYVAPIQSGFFTRIGLEQYEGGSLQDNLCIAQNKRCRYSELSEKLYRAIMSDIFKIKRSYVGYGKGTDTETQVTEVFNAIKSTNTYENYETLVKKFPQTVKMVKENNKTFRNMRDPAQLKIIDIEKIKPWNFYYSWLYSPEISDDVKRDVNGVTQNTDFIYLLYNEYFWYNVFVSYYGVILDDWRNSAQSADEKFNFEIEQDIISEYAENSATLLQLALEDLNEFSSTYLLHISLVALQETLLDLRNNYIAKVVTPIYTLYDKFRNVQPQ